MNSHDAASAADSRSPISDATLIGSQATVKGTIVAIILDIVGSFPISTCFEVSDKEEHMYLHDLVQY